MFLRIPRRHNFNEDLLQSLLEDGRKYRKRVCAPTDLELVMASPKLRKISKPDKFEIKLDVTHFIPEDIKIKTNGHHLIVEGNHGERLHQNGFVSRQFTRRYELPKNIDLEQISSSLSSDGQLLIEAPIKQSASEERIIPITFVEKQNQNIQNTEHNNKEKSLDKDKTIDGA